MKTAIRFAALLASTSLPVVALAQDVTETTVLKPIIVTAQKRATESKDVPASIAVKSGETLVLQKTKRRDDAIAAEPNAQTGAVTAKLYTSFTAIRGVGSALIECDPSVGVYLDGIGIGSAQAHSGTLHHARRLVFAGGGDPDLVRAETALDSLGRVMSG